MRPNIKKILLFATLIISIIGINKVTGQQSIYLEGLGHGFVYSVNYDKRLNTASGKLGFKLGCSYTPISNSNFLAIPVGAYYLKGTEPHYLELGAGANFYRGEANFIGDYDFGDANFAFNGTIAYRYQKPKGLIFRAGLTPILSSELFAVYFVGMSIGYSW